MRRIYGGILVITVLLASLAGGAVFAQTAEEFGELKDQIDSKKANIEQINRKIDDYKEKIDEKQGEVASLNGELDLLSNRIAKTELDIKATEEEIDAVNIEIILTDKEIGEYEKQLNQDRDILEELIREIDIEDNSFQMRILFGSESFSEIFDQLEYLENVNSDIKDVLDRTIIAKGNVEEVRREKEGKKAHLTDLQKALQRNRLLIGEEVTAKEVLVTETQMSEAQFKALLLELKQEQAFVTHEVARLQSELEARLYDLDELGDSTVLSWPAEPTKGISAYFHDPTYPYRHLFEHSGIDLPLNQGTPLKSVAPGYVAWAKTGRLYGNYVMIIHTNGIATLYAHMSRMDVVPDQFVTRGQVIGLSGGAQGSQGAGLSTGPHVHFEVRKNGIPVNPLDHLMSR